MRQKYVLYGLYVYTCICVCECMRVCAYVSKCMDRIIFTCCACKCVCMLTVTIALFLSHARLCSCTYKYIIKPR